MKKRFSALSDSVRVVGVRGTNGRRRYMDFYIVHPRHGREYLFTRRFTHKVYELTKGGVPIKDLLRMRSADEMTMALVKNLSYTLAGLMSEYAWLAA